MKKPNFYIPECQSPLLLVNPRAIALYSFGGVIHDDPLVGILPHAVDCRKLLAYAYSELAYRGDKHNYRLLDHYYVTYKNQVEYLFNVVGCGKCWLCTNAKRNDMVNRAAFETSVHDCPPIFFTLTYDDDHLPKNGSVVSYNLRYTDVQKFFKRLRKRFAKKGLPTDFRYLVAGEYGKQTHRPHYHVIMWNNPYKCDEFQPGLMSQLSNDIFQSWGLCQPAGFDFGQCSGGAARYVTKYLTKQVHYADRDVQPFLHSSIGSGGIGSKFLLDRKDYYFADPNLQSIQMLDSDGNFSEVPIGRYAKYKLHPSPSRLVPAIQKQYYKEMGDIVNTMVALHMMDFDDAYFYLEVNRPYKSVLKNPIKMIHLDDVEYCPTKILYLRSRFNRVLSFLQDQLDIDADVLASDIDAYTAYLCRYIERPDLHLDLQSKSWRIAEKFAVELNKEIL